MDRKTKQEIVKAADRLLIALGVVRYCMVTGDAPRAATIQQQADAISAYAFRLATGAQP